MGLFNLFTTGRHVVVVDGVALNESLGMKGKVPPRNQLQLLRRLSRFAQREKLDMVVVLSGTPLHKAPARQKFEEIKVLYSRSQEAHAPFVAKTARSMGSGAVLVSGSKETGTLAGARLQTMRISTFRKAFDTTAGDAEGSERGNSGRGGRNRQNRRRPQKPAGEKKAEQPPKEASEADAINELIDLVD